MRARLADEARQLLALGVRAHHGEDAHALAQAAVARVLAWKAAFLARRDDPGYQAIEALVVENAARRLPDLGRLALVPDPRDLHDLLRKAFPDRADADRIVHENAAWMEATLARLEQNPHVLRAPRALVLHAVATGREIAAWQMARVQRDLDQAYGPHAP